MPPRPHAEVDAILGPFAACLGPDRIGYRNHVQRVLAYYRLLDDASSIVPDQVVLAATFHDLGLWLAGSFDYIPASLDAASAHLKSTAREAWTDHVALLIREHHKLLPYVGPYRDTVERLRQADRADVSLGWLRGTVSRADARAVKAAYPDEGFHRRLLATAAGYGLRHPWRPLPMVHL